MAKMFCIVLCFRKYLSSNSLCQVVKYAKTQLNSLKEDLKQIPQRRLGKLHCHGLKNVHLPEAKSDALQLTSTKAQ